jgi:hypothetical protein
MGRSTTPTYALRLTVMRRGSYSPQAWNVKAYGRPTAATLATQVAAFEASTREGGCNAHLGAETVRTARVTRQSTGETVATYTAPAFAAAAA